MCVCIYIYIYNYFMLIINDSLNKRFCKKVFGFNISLFKKCYVHNIFTINFHNIMNQHYSNIFYSFNIFIGSLPHTQPNPFPFLFLFFFFFFPSVFPQPQEPTRCSSNHINRTKTANIKPHKSHQNRQQNDITVLYHK